MARAIRRGAKAAGNEDASETQAAGKRAAPSDVPAVESLRADVDARLAALNAKTQACVAEIRAELASQLALLSSQLRAMPLVVFRDTHGGALSSEVYDAVNAACVSRGAPHAERPRAPRPSAAAMPPPPPGLLRGAVGGVGSHAAFGPLAPAPSAVAPTPGAMAGPTVVRSGRTLRRTPPGADESVAPQPAAAGAVEQAAPFVAAATVLAGSRKRARVPGQVAVPPVPVWTAPPVPMATPGPTTGTRSQCRVPGTALVGATPMATRAPQQGEVFFSANGSPLGAFIDGVPSTPMGPVGGAKPLGAAAVPSLAAAVVAGDENDIAAVSKALEGLPEAKLAGLQSFISRLINRK